MADRPAQGPVDEVDLAQLRMANGDMDVAGGDSSPFGAASTSGLNRRSSRLFSSRDNECVTQIDPIVLTQKWTISNFATLLKLSPPGNCLRSTVFRDPTQPEACWQLCLYPGGKRVENANHVSLFLKMSATTPNRDVFVKAEYKFHFLDDNEHPRFCNVNIGDFHAKPPKGGHSWGLRNIPKAKVMNCIRADNSLVINCIIELIPEGTRMLCRKVGGLQSGPLTEMACVTRAHVNNELEMFQSAYHTDIVLVVENGEEEDKEIPAHRFKLTAHSDVFKAMLEHENMEECIKGRIRICDSSYNAVSAMLEFIYSGTIGSDNFSVEDYVDIMQLADKYNITSLKSFSEDLMVTKVTNINMIECLVLADRFNAPTLLERCVELMVAHRTKVMDSPEWSDLKEHNPRLANTVLEHLVSAEHTTPPLKRSRM